MQNFKLNKIFYLNIRKYHQVGVWGLKTSFGLIGPKRLIYQAITSEPYFQFSQTNTHFIRNPEENLINT